MGGVEVSHKKQVALVRGSCVHALLSVLLQDQMAAAACSVRREQPDSEMRSHQGSTVV